MAAQRVEERLEAAAYQATQDPAVDLKFADAGRALHLPGWRGADETDLHLPYRQLLGHVRHARGACVASASVGLPSGY